MAHLPRKPRLGDGSGRITSTHDGRGSQLCGGRHGRGYGTRSQIERRMLEDAHGAVPEDGLGRLNGPPIRLHGVGADVEHGLVRRYGAAFDGVGAGAVGNRGRHDGVVWKGEPKAGAVQQRRGQLDTVGLHERCAGLQVHRLEKGAGHGTPDQDTVHLRKEGLDDVDLSGHLGAAQNGNEGALGLGDGFPQVVEFLFHEEAGHRWFEEGRHAGRGRMGPVCRPESVVHIQVA